ncbi:MULTISPECIES: outer membrane beta-barrel family protein [Pedobacter]|uniref:outer membrane beta-barrel family protein n=1 Tax=Pedobacter TaxID=84567 RepID=UPI001E4F4924|nr:MULTISPECIES: outer membrane beta-barrel family protein [Pedobacter]
MTDKKYFLIIFLFFFIFNWSANAQQVKISVKLEKKPLVELFRQIQIKSGYAIVYSNDVVADTILISVNANNIAVKALLDSILVPKKLSAQLLSESLIVIRSQEMEEQKPKANQVLISGKVISTDDQGVPFVTVSLMENGMLVSGAIADENGNFKFAYPLKKYEGFTLKLTSLGYENLILKFPEGKYLMGLHDFGKIRLEPETKNLQSVQIKGNQRVIEMNDGNIIFNVSKSISAQGTNALELLARAPGVSVASDNSISLNGKAGASILIDGKMTYLSNGEVAELLKTMSSSNIRSIEIINSPGAKYDAAGTAGIINVKTLKSTVDGLNVSMTTGLNYGVYLRNNQDLSINYRKNRFNLYGSYSHFLGYYSYLYGGDRIQEGRFFNSFTDDIDKRNKIGSRVGADFIINKKSTVGILLNGNFLFGGGITDTRTDIGPESTKVVEQTLTAVNDYYAQGTQRYNLNANYKYEDTLGRILNIDADYGSFTKQAGNLQSNRYTLIDNTVISDNLYRSLNGIDITLGALKLDYTTNLWKGKLETGIKYSTVSSANDSRFLEVQQAAEILDPTRSNRFSFMENISSGYFNYRKQIGKWQLQSGLRVEHSASTGKLEEISTIAGNQQRIDRNYTNLFPFFSASLTASSSNSFSFSYSKRIDRPAYQNLNPFIYLLDELSFWQGNPFLKPQISQRGLIQYVHKSTIAGLSYTYTNDFSVEVTDTIGPSKIVMIPRNLGNQQHLALTLTQSLKPANWWDITFNGTFFRLYNNIDFGNGRTLDLKQTAARLSLQQTFQLPKGFIGEVMGFYNSKRLVGANQFFKPNSQIDLGLQRAFWQKNGTLRIVYSDIFKGSKGNSFQSVGNFTIRNYSYFETRQLKLSFSYKFSTGNSKGPRTRTSALENESGRIK